MPNNIPTAHDDDEQDAERDLAQRRRQACERA
jgi:hypothetical protein